MIIKMEIDVDEFWVEEGDSISHEIKEYIKRQVTKDVYKSIESDVKMKITEALKPAIQTSIQPIIDITVAKIAENKKMVKGRFNSDPDMTLNEFIKDEFSKFDSRERIKDYIHNYSERFTKELRDRYDLAFASKIVQNMVEHKLVNDKAIANLLESKQ